jgi:sucrose phosphorylase
MVLYTFYTQNATTLSAWAKTVKNPSETATFLNILDTHDGIGLMGVKGILSKEQIETIIRNAKKHGAYVSYKMTESRTDEPYEINSTWWSAVNGDDNDESIDFQIKRYIASRSIALVIQGVPGIYAHGAIGTPNAHELVKQTYINRDINRSKINVADVFENFKDKNSKLGKLTRNSAQIYQIRTHERAFHPQGRQNILDISPHVFSVMRTSPEGDQQILAITNVSDSAVDIEISLTEAGFIGTRFRDLISKNEFAKSSGKIDLRLEPYDIVWLKKVES